MSNAAAGSGQPTWKPAVYFEADTDSQVMRGEPYRLVAVRRAGGGLEVVESVWSQCRTPRFLHYHYRRCVYYFPPAVDAVVYLKTWYDFWREVDVRCDCGDAEFCNVLRRCAHELWVRPGRPLKPLPGCRFA
jgi:hypothetical protein